MISQQSKALPLWPAFVLYAAALYFAAFYKLRGPFTCGRSEMIDCNEYFANNLWLQATIRVAAWGTPGLIALFVARKALFASTLWIVVFTGWVIFVWANTYGINGKNGCEACDFFEFFMLVAAWVSLGFSILIAIACGDRKTPRVSIPALRLLK